MIVTIEPGIYFNDALIDETLEDEEKKDFLVKERIDEFRGFGGVRIEDDVLVTESGSLVLSKNCPKEIEEIESLMNAK